MSGWTGRTSRWQRRSLTVTSPWQPGWREQSPSAKPKRWSRCGQGSARLRRMPQIHLRAEEGDYAPLVLLPGDPNRARRISQRFDEGSVRPVNEHRGLLGFTGTYNGSPVSVQTSGMGTPSMSIVAEELLRLGAKRLIRVGTCGGIARGLKTGDLVIATAACPVD